MFSPGKRVGTNRGARHNVCQPFNLCAIPSHAFICPHFALFPTIFRHPFPHSSSTTAQAQANCAGEFKVPRFCLRRSDGPADEQSQRQLHRGILLPRGNPLSTRSNEQIPGGQLEGRVGWLEKSGGKEIQRRDHRMPLSINWSQKEQSANGILLHRWAVPRSPMMRNWPRSWTQLLANGQSGNSGIQNVCFPLL